MEIFEKLMYENCNENGVLVGNTDSLQQMGIFLENTKKPINYENNKTNLAIEEIENLLNAGISGLDLEIFGKISENSFKLCLSALKKLDKLEEYEKTLLNPSEVKELIIAVYEGNSAKCQEILLDKL